MNLLIYSVCMALLHSFWQGGLLWAAYAITDKVFSKSIAPQQKKNLLLLSISLQAVLFIITLLSYLFKSSNAFVVLPVNFLSIIPQQTAEKIVPWLFTTYCTVVFYKVIKAVYSWWLFKKQFKSGLIKPPAELKLFTQVHQYRLGINKKVKLWLSNTISTPLTFGFIKPVIVLPVALINKISMQQAETLVLHELAHIKANDFLFNWLVISAETIFFFNPFILLLCKKIKIEREKNCDTTIITFNYPPLVYAEALLTAQAFKQHIPLMSNADNYRMAAVNKPHHLLHRIEFFANPINQFNRSSNKKIVTAIFALVIVFVLAILVLPGSKTTLVKQAYTTKTTTSKITQEKIQPTIVSSVPSNFIQENTAKILQAIKKQKPQYQKQFKPIEDEVVLYDELKGENFATEVLNTEPAIIKQIIVKEEQSGSKNAAIKTYTFIYGNGKWQLLPGWKLSAKETKIEDTSKKMGISTHNNNEPELQEDY